VLTLVVLLAPPAAARIGSPAALHALVFRLPGKTNIGCLFTPKAGPVDAYLRCDVLSGLKPKPRGTCKFAWTGAEMSPKSDARPACSGDTVYDPRVPVLAFGKTWKRGGFTCKSQQKGLTCTNRNEHGFFLAKTSWRIF
jgi:hypothetical protein